MNSHSSQTVSFLKLSIHDHLVGYLAGYQNGKNVLHFAESFKNNLQRPTLSLITQQNFPSAAKVLTKPWLQYHQLPPTLSNLLPEGSLRELIAQQLKTHQQNELQLLSYLGLDLPGALIATPIPLNEIPPHLLSQHDEYQIVEIVEPDQSNKFSLAGVQMKFSMKAIDRRFTIPTQNALGDWIIKTPSSKHKYVPNNEFSAMSLAKLAGINIPEIAYWDRSIGLLPNIQLPDENHAYAIKRLDRHHDQRIHIEDFAQIFNVALQQKYQAANYTNIAKVIYQYRNMDWKMF